MKRLKISMTLSLVMLVGIIAGGTIPATVSGQSITMAVEFVDHAAAAHIALRKGWFTQRGLTIASFDNYVTGIALAAAMAHEDIDVAYMCLCPAILAYANGHIPIRIVCGTHQYGYGCLVNPRKIANPKDLLKTGVRIGCPREGSACDVVMNRFIQFYHLDRQAVLPHVRRMPPPNILMAMSLGQLDAGFMPEQFPTMGEHLGFKRLMDASMIWRGMQGSVVAVRESLIKRDPDAVKAVVDATRQGISYIKEHPDQASRIVAQALQAEGNRIFPIKMKSVLRIFQVTPRIIRASLTHHMNCEVGIDPQGIQDVIDYMARLGYIRRFKAGKMLDLRWLNGAR